MATMVEVKCENKPCGKMFWARKADRDRGWARFCSKSCKASRQTYLTGVAGPVSGSRESDPWDGLTDADFGHFPGEHDRF